MAWDCDIIVLAGLLVSGKVDEVTSLGSRFVGAAWIEGGFNIGLDSAGTGFLLPEAFGFTLLFSISPVDLHAFTFLALFEKLFIPKRMKTDPIMIPPYKI